MIIKELRVMRGPNMWSDNQKVIALNLDIENEEQAKIKETINFLKEGLPQELQEDSTEENPFMSLTRLTAKILSSLQGCDYSETHLKGEHSYYAVYGYKNEEVGVEAAYFLRDAIDKKGTQPKFNFFEIKEKLEKLDALFYCGPSTGAILEAAEKRGIYNQEMPGGLIQLGNGKYQKRVSASVVETTGNIAVEIAGNKALTKELLHEALIPVPTGYRVRHKESLKEVSEELGFPLVVKPLDGHQGNGITCNITDLEGLLRAFYAAKKYSDTLIIEKHIKGNDYRFLVIGYKLIAVANRLPAYVMGDGVSTIEELVEKVNSDPARGEGHGKNLTKIKIDDLTHNFLHSNNLNLYSIPAENQYVQLKGTANLSTGGTAIDVTDEVHPDNVLLAERVARIVGLDICGIDIMAPDVSTPLTLNGGAVIEVNAAPGLRMHTAPTKGKPRNVGDPIIDLLYPENAPHRIPIVAVTGTNGKTTTSRLMAHIASENGYQVGFTSTDGVYVKNKCIYTGDCSGPKSTKVVLNEPTVDFAVLECARGGIIRSGLAFKESDIAIVTNVAADHLGLKDIYTIEDLAEVKAVVPRSVSKNGYAVLNACDDLVYAMKDKVKSKVALFSIDPHNPRLLAHCNSNGVGITMNESGEVVIMNGRSSVIIENVKNIPLTFGGKALFMVENVLSTVLASYLLGIKTDVIRRAIRNFRPSAEQTPGRLNLFEINEVNVIVDYAHNPHGLKALASLLSKIDCKKTGIITGVGDRRDEDIKQVGVIAAGMYDEIIIRIDKDTRGRPQEEIVTLVKSGIHEVKNEMVTHVIPDGKDALRFAIEHSKKGEYVIISADDALKTIEIVKELKNELSVSEQEMHK